MPNAYTCFIVWIYLRMKILINCRFITPLLRSIILGMPPLFPTAFCMSFELATYGLISGILYNLLPK